MHSNNTYIFFYNTLFWGNWTLMRNVGTCEVLENTQWHNNSVLSQNIFEFSTFFIITAFIILPINNQNITFCFLNFVPVSLHLFKSAFCKTSFFVRSGVIHISLRMYSPTFFFFKCVNLQTRLLRQRYLLVVALYIFESKFN